MKKSRKYLIRALAIIVGVFVVFWIGMYIFFVVKKDYIKQQLSQEVGNALHGEFLVKDIGMNFFSLFPNVSLSLKGVEMRDSAWSAHKQSFLKSDKILLRINPFSLVSGKLRISKLVIENAVITLFSDTSGYTNEYLFGRKENNNKNDKAGFHIEELGLKNVRIIKSDQVKNKLYDFSFRKLKCNLDETGNEMELKLKIDGTIHSLAFNLSNGTYAREKSIDGNFKLHFQKDNGQISFNKIRLAIDKHPYIFSGLFDLSEKKDFRITIQSSRINYQAAIDVLPAKIADKLSLYKVQQPFNLQADISGKMLFKNLPKVNINAQFPEGSIGTPAGDFSQTSFTGNFTNAFVDTLPYTDENSMLTFTDLKGKYEGIPITSKKMTINNLLNPFLRCDVNADADLAAFNSLLSSASFNFTGGQATADIHYEGAIMSDTSTSLKGFVKLTNGSVTYEPRNLKLDNINGRIVFDSTDLYIKDLNAEAQKNKVIINAKVRNMLTLIAKDPSKLFLDADVVIPSLDLFAFNSLLGTRKKKTTSTRGKFARLAEKIDRFMDDCSIASRVHADHLKYKGFVATDVDAAISINSNKWNIQHVTLKNSEGAFSMNGTLTAVSDNNNAVQLNSTITNVNVSKLFTAFDNFGLSSLHAENLKGKLSFNAHLNAVLDNESRLITPSLIGSIDLSLLSGELINFEPLQKMAVFVLKKRDFSRVEFGEIKNTFEMNGSMLTINKMEVQSSVLGLFVEGIYDLKGKSTDLVVKVPLKYLKKREPGYTPENQGLDAKTGVSVYVRAKSGDNGDIDFKYGLFKKKSVLEKEEKEQSKKSTTSLNR